MKNIFVAETQGFPGSTIGKEPTWIRKNPWGGAWQPLQYSCLENPMDRGAW